jgi:hypothetical protein
MSGRFNAFRRGGVLARLLPCPEQREPLAVAVGSRCGAHSIELQVILIAKVEGAAARRIIGIYRAPLVDGFIEVDRSKADQD